MTRCAILGAAVTAVLLLVSIDEASNAPRLAQAGKGAKGAKGGGPPPIVHRTPAIGGAPVPPPVKNVAPPVKVVAPPIVQRTPAIVVQPKVNVHIQAPPPPPVVKQNVNVFVNNNINKFVAPTGKVPPREIVVQRPKIEVGGKGGVHVVEAYHKTLGNRPILVNGKAIEVRRREELVVNYQKHYQERLDKRFERATILRHDLGHRYDHLFAPHWWDGFRGVRVGWWGRWPGFATAWYEAFTLRHHWGWWRPVTWVSFSAWCHPTLWGPPVYYDYGGNVLFENNVVYVEGTPVASEADYEAQALVLASSGAERLANAPPSPDRIEQEWLPLGVFGVTNQGTGEPTQFVQLAINKAGVLAGTYTNTATNEALPITGAVDPQTQRASWFVGDNTKTVFETGAYNLSQPETQVLVHFGPNSHQTWLMVRMPEPQQ